MFRFNSWEINYDGLGLILNILKYRYEYTFLEAAEVIPHFSRRVEGICGRYSVKNLLQCNLVFWFVIVEYRTLLPFYIKGSLL